MAQPQISRAGTPALELPGTPRPQAPATVSLRPPKGERLGEVWYAIRRNPTAMAGFVLVGILVFCAVFAPWIAPYDPKAIDMEAIFQNGPNRSHPFGTDAFGRDVLSIVIWGARLDLLIALSAVAVSLTIGTLIGAFSSYVGGYTDEVAMRLMDILQAFPRFIFAMGIAYAIGPGIGTVVIATAVLNIPGYARLMRSVLLSAKQSQYAMAARSIGAKHRIILLRHLVPNCLAPIFVMSTLQFGWAILEAAGLSFIGLGVQPSEAEWGALIKIGFGEYLQGHWWVYTFPGLAIAIAVLGFNLIGDGLQDILDPRRR
ncbi:MAG: peptide/nickel transport system permease protein [Thermomicrobiales bacterium]|jgi:peptide/nickel transport system permease protein|nr:peptide/nickel transport system permease protein [Thermomicrobiales bacterium]